MRKAKDCPYEGIKGVTRCVVENYNERNKIENRYKDYVRVWGL